MTEISLSDHDKNTDNESNRKNDDIGIVIPCKVEDFGKFLTGLISKPQTIKGELEGVFEIEDKEISNVFHLIDQRIKEQNEGSLAHFEIKVVYDDGTSISHKTISDFESYYPTAPAKPEEIVISFNYIIKFQNRTVPEKQEIEIVFNAEPNKSDGRNKWYAGGLIEWRINHTERTWAADMNGLLKNHAALCINTNSGFWKCLRRYYEEIIHYFSTVVFMTVLISWLFSTFEFLETTPSYIQLSKFYTVSLVVLGLLYIFLGTIIRIITIHLVVKKESYICLIDKDNEYKKNQKNKSVRRLMMYFISFGVAILAGVISSYIYNLGWARGL